MTLFKPGHSIRGGRPIGAKNRLQKRFLDDLLEVWEQDGKSALKVAVRQDPQS
jgi:hypothetical protein